MPNCRWKAFLLLGAFLFTLTTLLYAHYYVLDFLFHDGDLQQRPLVNRSAFQEQDETVKKVEIEAGPCTLRQTVEADGKLRQRFNFTVPVFLWAEHFSPTEWQRLQRDFPPYGWKGLPKEVVNSTLHLLNETTNKGLFADGWDGDCIRCAVVGNGGILNGSKQGKAIDGHDLVFRLNGAVTKGFEEDVGTKISFYGFTTNTMKNSLIAYRKFGFERVPQQQGLQYIFIPSDIRDYVMLNSAIQGVPVPLGHDQWDM